MKHLDIFPVAFTMSKSCTFEGEKYYRLIFELNGKTYSVKNAEDKVGTVGKVQFLKAGEKLGDRVIAQDCFTLVGITDVVSITKAKESLKALKEMEP